MKEKVGIITLFDLNNVGNRLQNYAVTSVLEKMGYSCETLVPLRRKKQTQQEYWKTCRFLRFQAFTNQYIPWRELKDRQFPKTLSDEYDYFVTGSDQVWNPMFRSAVGQTENRLLGFAPPEKRICFSPSVGIDDIPGFLYGTYEKEWFKFRYLSVREQSGADLIKKITGRDASVLIDPTLMIDQEEWQRISKPLPGFLYEQKYILFYFLGNPIKEIPEGLWNFLEQEKKDKGLRFVRLFDPENPILMTPGPSEILSLFLHADLVCTDSFHGTVFSILFGKPFLLTDRILITRNTELNMSARINTLLSKLDLEDCLPGKRVLDPELIWGLDYKNAYEKLKIERQRVYHFLYKSFSREEEYENIYVK